MKLTASASGGFTGRTQHYEVDTGSNPAGPALEQALAGAGFFTAPADATPDAIGADLRRWCIGADDGTRSHSVCFVEDGSAATARWQEIVAQIRAAA